MTGQCAYGELTQKFVPLKIRIKHQDKNRKRYQEMADAEGMTLGEYLVRDIEIGDTFAEFATTILNMDYSEEPRYAYLIGL